MELLDITKNLVGKACEKGMEFGKAAKVKLEIISLESQISDYEKKIGKEIYEKEIQVKSKRISDYIERIDDLYDEIHEKKKEL